MEMTVKEMMDRTDLVTTIINEKRPLPFKGTYRLARLHSKLLPEYITASNQRDELIKSYDTPETISVQVEGEGEPQQQPTGRFTVPADKMPEYETRWTEIANTKIDVDVAGVAPIPMAQLDRGDDHDSSILAFELAILGPLIGE